MILCALLSAAALHYSATHFAIDTDPDEMLSNELPYRRKGIELARAFPQYDNSIVVIVDGPNADLVQRATDELAAALGKRADLFTSVYDLQGMSFFRQNGLLYLDDEELSELVDRLAAAQPLLGTLWAQPNLPGLFDVLRRGVEETRKGEAPVEIDFVFEEIASVVEAQAAGRTAYLSWQELMRGRRLEPDERRRFVLVQPALDYGSIEPAGKPLDGLRAIETNLDLGRRYEVRLRITGPTALETEELRSIGRGTVLATVVSSVLVGGLLLWGLRSPRLVAATLITLFTGLVWSSALAFLMVGRLNLVSVAFAVLFIGLSDDFGMHFSLRFREELDRGGGTADALRRTAEGDAGSLTLCAVAAAIGFFSFLPTDYVGLAELGWIAGVSMFVALFANLTLLPALLTLLCPADAATPPALRVRASRPGLVRRRARPIVAAAGAAAAAALVLSSRVRFDFDPLKLRDPESESVRALFDLAEDRRTTPYKIVELVGGLDLAARLADRLETLDVVENTVTLLDFVPKQQEEKLQIIEGANLLLLPSLAGEASAAVVSAEERRTSLDAFRGELAAMISTAARESEAVAERRLAGAFDALERAYGLGGDVLAALEERLVGTLPARLADLRLSLSAAPVTLADLPDPVRRRWVASDGSARLEVVPAKDLLNDDAALREFVREVRTVVPAAAGMPIDIVESGRAVVRSFLEATAIAAVSIAILVIVLVRRPRDVLLIFAPLVLAGVFTMASTVVLRQPFNFANVIVLPLLFGLGVASSIHFVLRERDEVGVADVLETSTPRAVVFSALTTIGSFGSLTLVRHPGTASMGILLTVAISLTLVCTLVVLPALMEMFPARAPGPAPGHGEAGFPGVASSGGSGSSVSRSRL